MNTEYIEVYDILNKIKKLNVGKYRDLVSCYGVNLVNKVIDDMIIEDEDNIYKFDFYLSDGLYSSNQEMDSFGYYLRDLSTLTLISSNEVKLLAREISKIVKRMNEIFELIGVDNKSNNKNNLGFSSKYITSIIDKIDYCLSLCEDDKLILELKELYDQFIVRRDKLVLGNLRFVIYVARPYYRIDISFNELVQAGNFGLMRAVESYDPDKYDVLFVTYAYYWVKQSIVRTIKNFIYSVDISHKLLHKRYEKEDVYGILSHKMDSEPTYKDVAEYMDLSLDSVLKLDMTYVRPISLNCGVINNCENDEIVDNFSLIDEIVDTNVFIEDNYIYREMLEEVRDILYSDNLKKKYFDVIAYRYGFIDGFKYTLEDIGKIYGITKEAVRQREEKGLCKIRKMLNERVYNGYLD